MSAVGFTTGRLLTLYDRISDAPDAVARLRRFVLDLAVRGKLVEQDPADKSPAWTPTTVTEDKERKVRSRLDPDLAEHPFGIPKAWRWVRIGDQLELLNGMAFKPSDWSPTGLRIVRIQNLNNPDAPFNYCAPERARERSLIDDGAFLISWSGTPGTSFGAFIWGRGPAVLNQHIFRCDFKTTAFTPQYLRLAINGRLDEMIDKAHGGVGLRHITKGKLEAMLIGLPPIAEQRRITSRFDELMALCDRLEEERTKRESLRDRLTAVSLARLTAPEADGEAFTSHARFALDNLPALTARPDQIKTLRQTILNLAVRGKLVKQDPADEPAPRLLERITSDIESYVRANGIRGAKVASVSNEEKPFMLPSGWTWTRLANICRVVTDGDHQPPPRSDDGIAFLTIGNVTTGKLEFSGCRRVPVQYFDSLPAYRTPAVGDLLYTVVGATFGRPVLVDAEEPFCVQRHIAILKPSGEIFTPYLHRAMASPYVYGQAASATTGAAQPTIALKPLRNFLIPLPPVAEQHRVVAKVDELMALCDRLEASLTAAETTRRRLLEALLHEALAPTAGRREAAE